MLPTHGFICRRSGETPEGFQGTGDLTLSTRSPLFAQSKSAPCELICKVVDETKVLLCCLYSLFHSSSDVSISRSTKQFARIFATNKYQKTCLRYLNLLASFHSDIEKRDLISFVDKAHIFGIFLYGTDKPSP